MRRKREFLEYAKRIELSTASLNLMIKTLEDLKGQEYLSGEIFGLEWDGREWIEKREGEVCRKMWKSYQINRFKERKRGR